VTNPLVVVCTVVDKDDVALGRSLWLWCPGCQQAHAPRAALPDGSRPDGTLPYWEWNGATDESFTISPSLLVRGGRDSVCHSFIRDGRWEFLGDCTHALAGQTVPMVPVPDWLVW
jgi:hypothetical protein